MTRRRGRSSAATKSAADSAATKVPSSPNSSTRARVLGRCAVVQRDGEAVAGEVPGEVAAHHRESGDTDLGCTTHASAPGCSWTLGALWCACVHRRARLSVNLKPPEGIRIPGLPSSFRFLRASARCRAGRRAHCAGISAAHNWGPRTTRRVPWTVRATASEGGRVDTLSCGGGFSGGSPLPAAGRRTGLRGAGHDPGGSGRLPTRAMGRLPAPGGSRDSGGSGRLVILETWIAPAAPGDAKRAGATAPEGRWLRPDPAFVGPGPFVRIRPPGGPSRSPRG